MRLTLLHVAAVLTALLVHMPYGADARRDGRHNKWKSSHVSDDYVLLSAVSTVIVHSGNMTVHRRVPAVAQL
ncbi:uncharacterized protein V1518DRAFT_429961, partial [Limtongia smithiae]|uniref:uncharacterized protein n=1 Tax=Limtongia smithiae TaxID=1125753 RepID=UPI0034CD2D28